MLPEAFNSLAPLACLMEERTLVAIETPQDERCRASKRELVVSSSDAVRLEPGVGVEE